MPYEDIPTNLILAVDSYKVTHHLIDPELAWSQAYGTCRPGSEHEEIVWAGLQSLMITYLEGQVVKLWHIERAEKIFDAHFMGQKTFNRAMWTKIAIDYEGFLPIVIKALPEGTVVTPGTPLFTIESTDPDCVPLVQYLETLLSHVWYPTAVATRSRFIKKGIAERLERTDGNLDALPYMLHDFGCRGVSSMPSAAIGGFAHLINFAGTDTVPALELAIDHYNADPATLGFSIPATEHANMTLLGAGNDIEVLRAELKAFPTGIVACVIDSFDPYLFVEMACMTLRDEILDRDGKVVFRPDSNTDIHPNPPEQVVWILDKLWKAFGGTYTDNGYKKLDPHVGVIWGDGLTEDAIFDILDTASAAGYAASNLAFGMGGGLLQKVNRDTERFAIKRCAVRFVGSDEVIEVRKETRDPSKSSRGGDQSEGLVTVFDRGRIVSYSTMDQIRERAAL